MNTPLLADSVWVELVQLAQAVSAQLRVFYADPAALDIQHKADESPVTAADLAAHQMIEQGLQQLTPTIPLLSEESADHAVRHAWDRFWLVDPLDGTKEFINRTGEFTVNIALIDQGQVHAALIAIPMQQQVYAMAQGHVWRIGADQVWHV
ncbi:MAG: inositol monophosphatase family protein, partial [Pseudomonadota bacterium]|nr:inositol monophosphatase family protein [Pseudomonadota bacterium]